MKKKIILAIFVIFISSNASALTCSNLQGSSTTAENNNVDVIRDGFSGETIRLSSVAGESNLIEARWGQGITDNPVKVHTVNDNKWNITVYVAPRRDVMRTYTLYQSRNKTVLGISELQTRIFDNAPQQRNYFANCR